jgi:hypothetical protein
LVEEAAEAAIQRVTVLVEAEAQVESYISPDRYFIEIPLIQLQ